MARSKHMSQNVSPLLGGARLILPNELEEEDATCHNHEVEEHGPEREARNQDEDRVPERMGWPLRKRHERPVRRRVEGREQQDGEDAADNG
jgi:hypothetical protein